MTAGRFRADFYFLPSFLVGLGCFRDQSVSSHDAMKLIFGVNRPFRIRLDRRWIPARTVLLDSECPHYLNGEGDWQVILWVDSRDDLAGHLRRSVLRNRPWSRHDVPEGGSFTELIQTAGDDPDLSGAQDMAETLLRVYAGVRPLPTHWDDAVSAALKRIQDDPGGARITETPALSADFRRVLGVSLEDYLFRRRLWEYLRLRKVGMEQGEALRRTGLPGYEGLKDRFHRSYGLDLDMLEKSDPFVGVFGDSDALPARYL